MPLFGKNSVQEAEAAKRFLQELNSDIFSNWPAICQVFSDSAALEPGKPTFSKCSENKAAAFEFYLAVVAMQLPANSALLSSNQEFRLREYVCDYLKGIPADSLRSLVLPSELYMDESGFEIEGDEDWDDDDDIDASDSKVLKVFHSYIRALEELIEEGNPAIRGPAYFLCRRLNLIVPPSRQQPGGGLARPFLTSAVFRMMTDIGGSWWKDFLGNHNLVS